VATRRFWVNIGLLVLGYAGYYLCRSNFSVAKPLLLNEFPDIDKAKLGLIASVGTLLYAIGKFVHGPLADRLGGRLMFLYGMVGAIAFSVLFGLGGPPLFMLAWAGNRFVQSAGWGGMVRVVSQWTSAQKYGAVMGVVSLSYLFGDFASRLLLGYWVSLGATWRDLFFWSAVGLVLIAVPSFLLLRERPPVPLPTEPQPTAARVYALPGFTLVCVLSFVFTFLRETFNEWTPTYLHESARLSEAGAAQASSLFPLLGGLSVLAIGAWSDRLGDPKNPRLRLRLVPLGLGVTGALLAVLGLVPGLNQATVVTLVAAIGFALIGPYSLLAGATSLDFGGDQRAASAAGLIDGVGYLGGILSGYVVGKLAQTAGWAAAMLGLAVLCAVVSVSLWLSLNVGQKVPKVGQE
jgi:OPA family glycerol-3-phosphate transporter-like MFS transporter